MLKSRQFSAIPKQLNSFVFTWTTSPFFLFKSTCLNNGLSFVEESKSRLSLEAIIFVLLETTIISLELGI